MTDTTSAQDTDQVVAPRVTFLGESASYRTTLGMYKIDENGLIYDVEIIFADISDVESGGSLISGETSVELNVGAGDSVGFFVMPDAYNLNDESAFNADRYELRDWGGSLGNIYDDTALRLYAIDDTTGESTLVDARWNAATWHMHHNEQVGIDMNSDGTDHAKGHVQYDGSVSIGFSDVYGSGDGRMDALLINVNFGTSGAVIVDSGMATGTDQTVEAWVSPCDIQEGLPEVPIAVVESNKNGSVEEKNVGGDESERPATVTFMGEGAWYQSTFGMYKIDENGSIYDIEIVFANASNQGSGGDLIAGQSTVEIDAQAGDNLGFFILSDGWRMNSDKSIFDADSYVFRDWSGTEGNIYWGTGLRLFAVDAATGEETLVNARFNAASWHMHHKPEDGIDMNVDNFDHMRGQLKYDGSVTVGFEDISGGGDQDFNDVMFNIDLGTSGAVIDDENIYNGTDQREGGFTTEDGAPASAKVTFLGETADFKNTIGMYKIAEDGSIVDVQLIFANASKYDSGGELIVGESSVDIDVSSTDKLGFFILPDGYRRNSDKSLFEGSNYVLRNASGELGNVYSDNGLKLFHVDETTGIETMLHARYGNSTYHMLHDLSRGINLNGDGLDHALGEARDGNKVVIGFEDIKKNGDWDFDDVVIQIELTNTGATVDDQNLRTVEEGNQHQAGWIYETNVDVFDQQPWLGINDRLYVNGVETQIDGLEGDDVLIGDDVDNILIGGNGHDVLLGEGGNDLMEGGSGFDQLNGGAGNDVLYGGAGNDRMWGLSGDDTMFGDESADKMWGNAGSDTMSGGAGNDTLYGGAGDDVIIGGKGRDELYGGEGADVFLFKPEDLNGSEDVIADLQLFGAVQDAINLSQLGLLASGQTRTDWLAANVTQSGNDVILNLGNGTLTLSSLGPLVDVSTELENALIL